MPSDPQGTIVTFDDLEPNTVVTFDDAPMAQPSQPAQSFAVEGPPRPQFPLPTAMGAYEFLRTGGGDAAKRQLELESQALGSSIQIGEAPFAARAKAAFGMESSKPLEQLMPDYDFRTIESEGPLKGKQLYRRKNSSDPWSTVDNPYLVTGTDVGVALGGSAAPTLGGIGLSLLTRGRLMPLGSGGGSAGGEIIRQKIGENIFGLSPTPPGVDTNAPEYRQAPGSMTREQMTSVGREALVGTLSPIVGNAVVNAYTRIFGAGAALPTLNVASYEKAFRAIEQELVRILGPEEARNAMARLSASDVAASLAQGGILDAQINRIRASAGAGSEAFRIAELKKQQYLESLGRRLLGMDGSEVSPTEVGRGVAANAPQGSRPSSNVLSASEIEQRAGAIQSLGEERRNQLGMQAVESMSAGRAAPVAGNTQSIMQTVEGAAPAGTSVTGQQTINPRSPWVGAQIRTAINDAYERVTADLGLDFRRIEQALAGQTVAPTSLQQAVVRYEDILQRRTFPSLSPEDDRVVRDFIDRAFERDAEGAIIGLRNRSYEELRQDSSNLKKAIRDSNKGNWSGNIQMLRDLADAIDNDIYRLVRGAPNGEQLAARLEANNGAWREAMDLFERSGAGKVRRLRTGGAELMQDEQIASRVANDAEFSNSVFESLQGPENAAVRATIAATLRWELIRRAAPGTGRNVNREALENVIRDKQSQLNQWLGPDEINALRTNADEILRVRDSMGVGRNTSFEDWFDKSFWNGNPGDVGVTLQRLRTALPADGPGGSRQTIETLQALTRQRVYSTYTKLDENGRRVFDPDSFFKDMLDSEGKRNQFFSQVFGPEYAARANAIAEGLSKYGIAIKSQADAARARYTTEAARGRASNALNDYLNAQDDRVKDFLGVSKDNFNATKWFDERWGEADAGRIERIVNFLGKDSETVKNIQNLALNRIYREITTLSKGMKGSATAGPEFAINEEALVNLVRDPARKDWLVALFGSPDAAYAQLDKLATTVSLLSPGQSRTILTQATDPALVSIEQLRRLRNVAFGPLNPNSRLMTRMLEWGSDQLRDRAARALVSPDEFLRLQQLLQRTEAGEITAGVVARPAVEWMLPNSTVGALATVKELIGGAISGAASGVQNVMGSRNSERGNR